MHTNTSTHYHMHINRSQSGRLRMCPQRDGEGAEETGREMKRG